jgi:hypothetical protein
MSNRESSTKMRSIFGPGNIYFIWCVGAVKIGFTGDKNVKFRFQAIQVSSPHEMILLGTKWVRHPAEESRLHNKFSHLWIRGEWFVANDELESFFRENFEIHCDTPWCQLPQASAWQYPEAGV